MTTSLTDQLGAKLRAELIRPKGQCEHDGVLSDATAFNMAVRAKDDDTIRNLARKYGVKTPPKTSDEPKPKNGSGDMPVDSDEIAGKVLEGLKPHLATDNGNTALANALKFGGVAAIIMVIFTIIMEIVFWHHTLDVAAAMTLGLGALGFVVGMAVGAIIPSRNN